MMWFVWAVALVAVGWWAYNRWSPLTAEWSWKVRRSSGGGYEADIVRRQFGRERHIVARSKMGIAWYTEGGRHLDYFVSRQLEAHVRSKEIWDE